MRRLSTLLLLIVTLSLPLRAASPVAISVSPRVQMALYGKTTQVTVQVTVPKDAQNRVLCIEIDGGVYTSSCFPHVGTGASSQVIRPLRGLTAGEYVAVATVLREDGTKVAAKTTFCVAGGEGECGLGGEP